MRLLNMQLYKMVAIALTLSVPYSAYALPTIEEDQTVAYNTNRSNNDLLEIYGTLNNNARLVNNDVIDIYGVLNNNSTGQFINNTSGTITSFGNVNNSGNFTNRGTYFDNGQFVNSGTYTNNLDAYVYADAYIENTASGKIINNGEFSNGTYPVKNFGTITNNGTMYTNELQNHGAISNTNSLTLDRLYNSFEGTIFNSGNIYTATGIKTVINVGTIQNQGDFDLRGEFDNTGNVTGNGYFFSDQAFITNDGQMTQSYFGFNRTNVSGSGTFAGDMFLGGGGITSTISNVNPQNTLTLNGNLLSALADYNFYFGYYDNSFFGGESKLVVNGETTFYEGVFNIDFGGDYSLYDGLTLTLMTSNQILGSENLSYKVNNLSSNWSYKINSTGTDISISISAVPEPESYGMLIAGLVLVRLASRNRKLSLPA